MPLFSFDGSHVLGNVREVDTRKVSIMVRSNEDLRKAHVGHLVAMRAPGAVEAWLIGMVDKVYKACTIEDAHLEDAESEDSGFARETIVNIVRVTLVGTAKWESVKSIHTFSRSLVQVPEIDTACHVLRDLQLEVFMGLLARAGEGAHSLELGRYAIDESAVAYIDGNKLFQRHAALLGSTGSGKSWTVASILERAATLPSSNLIVFDLHGEYNNLSYAKHLRIPGPEDLGTDEEDLLYLPYWLLNAEEMQAMFLDRSEFNAHNQVMAFQDSVIEQKKVSLEEGDRGDVLAAFTLDSPVPFSIKAVIDMLTYLNEEREEGAKAGTTKAGKFFGQFSRLLMRIRSKLTDKRYGFLFQAPDSQHQYATMGEIARKLMGYETQGTRVKVVDFSEVPADILPVIVALVARVIYQVQFWTDHDQRRPLAFVCDEAHLYIPKKEGQNPVERRAIETFEKIAKEGRKYGVALMVVSQRPSDVSTTVLSQCNNVIALRLTNADDQSTVRKLMPESLESILEVLPIMDTGEGLVVGDAVLLPCRVRITPPSEKPRSATIDFWSEWQKDVGEPDFDKAVENMRRQRRFRPKDK